MIESIISIAFCLSTAITVLILLLPSQYEPKQANPAAGSQDDKTPKTSVQILVLGDIGRSPRMQYHALSIARQGGDVVIIGYKGTHRIPLLYTKGKLTRIAIPTESDPHPEIMSHPRISIVPLRPHPALLQTSNKMLFTIYGPLKVIFQVACLWQCLAYSTKPSKWLLVQVWSRTRSYTCLVLTFAATEPTLHPNARNCLARLFPQTIKASNRLA